MISKFLRIAAVASLAAAALALPTLSGAASAAPVATNAASSTVKAPAMTAADKKKAKKSKGICVNAHVQNIGWQGWKCGSNVTVGTTGQSLRMEALAIYTNKGSICAQGHVQNIGWQSYQCRGKGQVITIGTTGQSLRMEALKVWASNEICVRGHVQDTGWQQWDCSGLWYTDAAMAGTEGQGKRLEAVKFLTDF